MSKEFFNLEGIVNLIRICLLTFSAFISLTVGAQDQSRMNAIYDSILSIRKPPLISLDVQTIVNVRDFGAIPDDELDDYNAVQAAINSAKTMPGPVQINFEKGKYYVTPNQNSCLMQISDAANILVDGNGAEIIIKRQAAGFCSVLNSNNIIVRNFSIDYDPLPFSECVVTSVDNQNGTFVVNVNEGYPLLSDPIYTSYSFFGLLKDPVFPGKLKQGVPNFLSVASVISLGERIFQITLNRKNETVYINKGDRYTHVFRPGEVCITGRARNSEDITFQNITSFACPSILYGSFLSSNFNVLSCSAKVKEGRLTVSTADGVHVQSNRIGPWIENCELSGLSDDSFNFYGTPCYVLSLVDAMSYKLQSVGNIKINDHLSFWNPNTGEILAELNVVSISGTTVTFDKPVPALNIPPAGTKFDSKGWVKYDHAYNTSCIGNNFVIRNNYIHDSRRFGMYIKASNGIIENNRILRMSNSAIRVNNEPTWPEGFYTHNLIVKNNIIEGCTFESFGVIEDNAPVNVAFQSFQKSIARNEKNIFIDANKITALNTPVLRFKNAENIFITNDTLHTSYKGNLITLSNTCSVNIKNNDGVKDTIIICTDSQPPLSVLEKVRYQSLKIFPVPCSTTFFIEVPGIERYNVRLLSVNGKVVKDFGKQSSNCFNISNVPHGNYIVSLVSGNEILHEKIIVKN